jgi:carbon-monoxide dehydrogenase medium subunit
LQMIADLQVRNAGTLGGSCCQADPYGDMPNVMVALGAEMTVQSVGGLRRIPAEAFFVGPLQTSLTSTEILTAMHFDSEVAGSAYEKFSWRKGDYAIVSVACRLDLNSRNEISRARVVVGGLGRGPARFKAAEEFITGKSIASEALLEGFVIEEGALLIEPDAVYGSAEYKRHLVGVMSRKCVAKAVARIRKGR